MRGKFLKATLALFFAVACAAGAGAQTPPGGSLPGARPSEAAPAAQREEEEEVFADDFDLKNGTYEFGAWGGGSPGSTTFFGRSPDRKLALAGFNAGRVIGSKKHFKLVYTVDVIPFVRLVQPREASLFATNDGGVVVARSGPDATGAGLSPVGLKFLFRRRERVKPFFHTTAGFIYFDRPVPYDAARRFNFAFDFSGGVQIFSRRRSATTLGYKFHHFSNAGTADINPGVDSHVFYAGFSFFRR